MSTVTTTRPAVARASSMHGRTARPSIAASIDPIRVLRRHAIGIAAAALIGGFLGVTAYFVLAKVTPLYTSRVMFEIQPGIQEAGQVGVVDISDDNMVYRIAQTETYMLTSRGILEKAMKNPDIRQTAWHKKFIRANSEGRPDFLVDEALDELEEDVSTGVMRATNLFSLQWSAAEPKDVPIVLNAIAQAYLQERRDRDREVYDGNLSAFQRQLEQTQDTLDDISREIRSMITTEHMTELEGVWRSAQAIKQQELTKQLADATSALNIAETNFHLVSEKLKGTMEYSSDDVYQAEHDTSIQNMIESIEFRKAQRRELYQQMVNPDHPKLIAAEAELRAMEEQRDAKIQEIIRRNLEAEMRTFDEDRERFRNAADQLDVEIEANQKLLEDLAQVQAEYEALKTRQEHLEVKRTADLELINEVQMLQMRADASRVRRAQPALLPREPSFPKKEIIIPLGVLLMVGLTVGVVFLRELMDQRVKGPSDLAVLPGAHVLGSIPDLIDDPTKTQTAELVVRKHPMSVLAESYRTAATTLLPLMDRNGHQTLLLLGGLPGSGTTTAATNIAAAAAATGRRVLVVDANFRRPRLAMAMNVPGDGPGFADLLTGSAPIDDAIIDVGDGISVVPAGTPANRVIDRLNNGTFDSVVAELRGRYDLIIFDAPPAVVAGDALVLANKVDAAVLVVRAHQEHRGLVARMINRLSDARCELLGVLLNRPRGIAGGYLKKNYATMAEYGTSSD